MYKLLVKSAEKVFFQANDSYVLEVELHIFKEDKPKKIVDVRKLAFPLDIKEKDLQNELKKYIAQYNAEQKMFEENKEKDRVAKQSDEVIKLIEGKEL
jgi:hypothetical protein